MANRYSKGPRRTKTVVLRILEDEYTAAVKAADEGLVTLSDLIRERCGWEREDGKPNRPWSTAQCQQSTRSATSD